jgi:hypothetical protein
MAPKNLSEGKSGKKPKDPVTVILPRATALELYTALTIALSNGGGKKKS